MSEASELSCRPGDLLELGKGVVFRFFLVDLGDLEGMGVGSGGNVASTLRSFAMGGSSLACVVNIPS